MIKVGIRGLIFWGQGPFQLLSTTYLPGDNSLNLEFIFFSALSFPRAIRINYSKYDGVLDIEKHDISVPLRYN